MQQAGEWLAKLGLAEYAKCFADNRIDFSVLPELTDQDLKNLGILLGDIGRGPVEPPVYLWHDCRGERAVRTAMVRYRVRDRHAAHPARKAGRQRRTRY